MSRRRQIHHAQSVSSKLRNDENIAACAPIEALEWPEGTYTLVRIPGTEFRDKPAALAEVLRRHPNATIGKSAYVRGKWIVRVRLPKEEPNAR